MFGTTFLFGLGYQVPTRTDDMSDHRNLLPRPSNRLSTEEAAARLGVKKETIYAYVSRGIISRHKAVDGRASTFDADEVDRLRRQRAGEHKGQLQAPVTSSITEVGDGLVAYRGKPVDQLVAEDVGFEGAAELLWGSSPARPWVADQDLVRAIRETRTLLGDSANLIDHLVVSTALASTRDPFRHDRDPHSAVTSVRILIASAVDALAPRSKAKISTTASIAERLWPRLSTAARSNAPVLDRTLMLLADHGMASSTMAARIAASTRGGPHAAIIAGLGALNGRLHGAAGQAVHELLTRAENRGVESAVAETLRQQGKVPGIGHFIHRTNDPRFSLIMDALTASALSPSRLDTVREVIELTESRIPAPHNIDFALGSLSFVADMTPDAGELIFAIARMAGWTAHAIEEHGEAPLRFRPVGRYEPVLPRTAPD